MNDTVAVLATDGRAAIESTTTLKATVTDAPAARVPPAVLVAPAPTRTLTVRDPAVYSPVSSPTASLTLVVVAPLVTLIDPGTRDTPAGSTSTTELSVAALAPWFLATMEYCRVSPSRTAAPLEGVVTVLVVTTQAPEVTETSSTKLPYDGLPFALLIESRDMRVVV